MRTSFNSSWTEGQVPDSILSHLTFPFELGVTQNTASEGKSLTIAIPMMYTVEGTERRVPVQRVNELVSKISSGLAAELDTEKAKTIPPEDVELDDLVEKVVGQYYSQMDTETVLHEPGPFKENNFDLKDWAVQFTTGNGGSKYEPLVSESSSWLDTGKKFQFSTSISRSHPCELELIEETLGEFKRTVSNPEGEITCYPRVRMCDGSEFPLWSLLGRDNQSRIQKRVAEVFNHDDRLLHEDFKSLRQVSEFDKVEYLSKELELYLLPFFQRAVKDISRAQIIQPCERRLYTDPSEPAYFTISSEHTHADEIDVPATELEPKPARKSRLGSLKKILQLRRGHGGYDQLED